jgi:uncharacterized membrane protein
MNAFVRAAGIGAVSGGRSMLGPALVTTSPWAHRMTTALAIGEMTADKTPQIPARTAPMSIAGRMAFGAMAAATAAPRAKVRAGLIGAAGALAATFALFHARRFATERLRVPNAVAGLAEDALLIALGRRFAA